MNRQPKRVVFQVALLVALLMGVPRLVMLLVMPAGRQPGWLSWSDLSLQVLFSVVFVWVMFRINEPTYPSRLAQVGLNALAYVVLTVLFMKLHGWLLDGTELMRGVRIGYIARNGFMLLAAVLLTNLFRANAQKQDLALRNKALETENLRTQLLSLQQQLNPHFLFNSLNALHTLVRTDSDRSQRFVEHLSAVLRYSLTAQQKSLVPLTEERQLLDAYLYLLQIRFGDKLQVRYDGPDRVAGYVPPLSLQLLLENVVNHNEISAAKPMLVEVCHDAVAGTLRVSHARHPKRQPTTGTGLGLANLANRFRLLGPRELTIEQTDAHFAVTLPILPHDHPAH